MKHHQINEIDQEALERLPIFSTSHNLFQSSKNFSNKLNLALLQANADCVSKINFAVH